MILLAYLIWVPVAFLIFLLAPRKYAPWLCLIGGWVLLPPAIYPALDLTGLPYWIVGGSLPSNVMLNKAWIAPLVACLVSLLFDARRWRDTSLSLWDAPIAGFCLWPIIQQLITGQASPSGWMSSLYLTGSWALPWWLGRVYLQGEKDICNFVHIVSGAMLLLLPIAIFESLSEVRIHTVLLERHPFASDGVERYVGYRPQALFEHGNQYGLWCAASAVAAFWIGRERRSFLAVAAILAAMTLASQSAGAIALMAFGIFALAWSKSFTTAVKYGPWIGLTAVVMGGLMIAGLLPVRAFIDNTGVGQMLLDAIRSTGRGSFAWRISQDLKAAPLLREHLIIGHATWDWFMTMKSRPWGFPLLVVGQFGLIGFSLLILPLMRSLWDALRRAANGDNAARLVTVLMIIAGLDAVLNSFLFWPAIVLAAASTHTNKGPDASLGQQDL